MNWTIDIFTFDGRDYAGICECEEGMGEFATENEADQACIKFAQEHNLPLFSEFRQVS